VLQRDVLAVQVVAERIDPNDKRLKAEEGYSVKTAGSYRLTLMFDDGTY
jgi:hypothetical protein